MSASEVRRKRRPAGHARNERDSVKRWGQAMRHANPASARSTAGAIHANGYGDYEHVVDGRTILTYSAPRMHSRLLSVSPLARAEP